MSSGTIALLREAVRARDAEIESLRACMAIQKRDATWRDAAWRYHELKASAATALRDAIKACGVSYQGDHVVRETENLWLASRIAVMVERLSIQPPPLPSGRMHRRRTVTS